MTPSELACLAALSREADLERAARACGLSVPDFRAALATLEAEFDTALLLPGERFTGFTAERQRVLGWAARTLDACDGLRRDVQASQADAAVAALIGRRSVSPKRLGGPAPSKDHLQRMLQAALRAPDHGGLHPWRVIEFEKDSRPALADVFEQEKRRRDPLAAADDIRRAREHATRPPALLAFVVTPRLKRRIPLREQWLSAGAALGNLLNAAHRLGHGAIVLSGERCFDPVLMAALGVGGTEFLAGFISIGRIAAAPPAAPTVPVEAVMSRWQPQVTASQAERR